MQAWCCPGILSATTSDHSAISAVLAHPTKRANPLRASRKPLPPVAQPPPLLPKPYAPSYYDGYLKSIAPLYEQFLQSQAAATASAGDIDLQQRKSAADLPSLDNIPATFFDTDFDLANPTTWNELMKTVPESTRNRDDELQNLLSTHLDNLERHLVHEITLRSSSFFSALSNLQDLNAESTSCLNRIAVLKSSLKDVGSKQARKGLEIIDAQARLKDLRITEAGVKRMAELDEILRVARGLADGGDWSGSLDCVEDVVRWWERNDKECKEGDNDKALALNTLPALANLPTSIAVLTTNIATQLESVLSSVLQSFLSEADQAKPFDAQELRARVGGMLSGLMRCGKGDALITIWRNAVTTAIREGLRQVSFISSMTTDIQHLPGSNSSSSQDDEEIDKATEVRGQTLAQSLQSMSHSQFLELCKKMYNSMLARLHLVQKIGEEMSAMMSENQHIKALIISVGSDAPLLARSPELPPFEPSDVLFSACELANTRASKILSVRNEQNASLPLEQFVEVFNESWQFVVATEVLAKRMIVSLRGVAASQARAFLVSYHAQKLTRSAKLVEEETWVQIDVPPSTQHAVDIMIEAAVKDPAECVIPFKTSNGANGEQQQEQGTKLINIEGKSFFVVTATSESLSLLSDYLAVVINLELVVTDVMSRIIEFLKSFNSRTCQVVLGAGAMRSAGLKNITAKHLALASQSLSVVIALIPYIREFIRRHLNPKQAVMLTEFDKLKGDYQEHQNEIHAKLVAIMADRLAVHVSELREIDWEATPAKEGPHQYAQMLVKETATLHKVLSKYLASNTVIAVMSQVLAASVHRLTEEYAKIELKSEDAKRRMLQDAILIVQRLTPLSELPETLESLETLVKEKPTPKKNVAANLGGLFKRHKESTSPAATTVELKDDDKKPPLPEKTRVDSKRADAGDEGEAERKVSPKESADRSSEEKSSEAPEKPVESNESQSKTEESKPETPEEIIKSEPVVKDATKLDEESKPPVPEKEKPDLPAKDETSTPDNSAIHETSTPEIPAKDEPPETPIKESPTKEEEAMLTAPGTTKKDDEEKPPLPEKEVTTEPAESPTATEPAVEPEIQAAAEPEVEVPVETTEEAKAEVEAKPELPSKDESPAEKPTATPSEPITTTPADPAPNPDTPADDAATDEPASGATSQTEDSTPSTAKPPPATPSKKKKKKNKKK